jgi:hypothetical protein
MWTNGVSERSVDRGEERRGEEKRKEKKRKCC